MILYPSSKNKSPKNRRFSKKKKRGLSRSKDRRKENTMISKGERRNWLSTNKSKDERKNSWTKIIAAIQETGITKVKEDTGMMIADPRIDIMIVVEMTNHLENNRLEAEKIENTGRRKSIMMDLLSLQLI